MTRCVKVIDDDMQMESEAEGIRAREARRLAGLLEMPDVTSDDHFPSLSDDAVLAGWPAHEHQMQ